MANPQAENGHIDIANEIADALAGIRISGEENQCLWVILRKTYGWKKKFDWIALSQFEEMTGIKRPNIVRALSKLIMKNMVIKKDNSKGVSYGFQKDYKKWKPLSKKITLSKKIMPVIKKDNKVLSKKIHTKDTITKDTITKEMNYPDWLPLEEWSAFVVMRKSIKKPMTDYAMKLAIGKLNKFKEDGYNAKDILNNSILGCYQGLFIPNEEKDNPQRNGRKLKKLS